LLAGAGGVGFWLWRENDKTERLERACDIGANGIRDSTSGSSDSFVKLLSKTITVCGESCDRGTSKSCRQLDETIEPLCGAAPETCEKLCKTEESPSIKKLACEYEDSGSSSKPKKKKSKSEDADVPAKDSTGIPACDEYLAAVESCKGPGGTSMRDSAKQLRDAYKDTPPSARETVSSSCRQAHAAMAGLCD
jgi:hypothetical protein